MFQHYSIQKKLVVIMTMVSGITILLGSVVFFLSAFILERREMNDNIRMHARIIAMNSRAALIFNDADTARTILGSLEIIPSIQDGILFDLQGKVFVFYKRPGHYDYHAVLPGSFVEEKSILGDDLIMQEPILLDGERIGTLVIHATLEEIYQESWRVVVLVFLVLVVVLPFSFFLSVKVQKVISRPIEALRKAAIDIGNGRFDTEITVETQDEIGDLAMAFRSMAQDLAKQRKDLEHANRAKSEFLANMSHEIRTPMNALVGLTELALQTETSKKTRDYLTKITHSSRSLLRIINDILDFSKIEAGKLELEQHTFVLREVLDRLLDLFRVQAGKKKIELVMALPDECFLQLVGDSLRLEQVLMNLLANALKFTEEGEIELRVESQLGGEEEAILKFTVRDTGIGMEEGLLGKLFAPFSQGDSSTTRKYGGSGLGLSICQRLVELMGGTLCVTSKVGSGSQFSFILSFPYSSKEQKNVDRVYCSSQADSDQIDIQGIAAQIGGAHVLLVEDNAINQQVAQEILEMVGLRVSVAHHGEEALAMVATTDFHAVLMDIQMPVMDGYTATRRMRQEERLQQLPIIAMTAHAMSGDREKSLAAGMSDHVAKPIARKELFAALTTWIKPRQNANVPYLPVLMKKEEQKRIALPDTLPGIDLDAALERINGNRKLFRSLLLVFWRDYAQMVEQIQTYLAGDDEDNWQTAYRMVHSLRGMAGNLSAHALFHAASELENEIGLRQTKNLSSAMDHFKQEHWLVSSGIANWLEKVESEQAEEGRVAEFAPPVDWDAIIPLMKELDWQLSHKNVKAQGSFENIKERLAGLLVVQSSLRGMEENIERYDFPTARTALLELAQTLGISWKS